MKGKSTDAPVFYGYTVSRIWTREEIMENPRKFREEAELRAAEGDRDQAVRVMSSFVSQSGGVWILGFVFDDEKPDAIPVECFQLPSDKTVVRLILEEHPTVSSSITVLYGEHKDGTRRALCGRAITNATAMLVMREIVERFNGPEAGHHPPNCTYLELTDTWICRPPCERAEEARQATLQQAQRS